jgi:hypothetical protein
MTAIDARWTSDQDRKVVQIEEAFGTVPFWRETDNADPDEIALAQIGPNLFRLETTFRYKAAGDPVPYEIPAGAETDLTSAKWPIWWLIASYGTHTKASLLHDVLIEPDASYPRVVSRQRADALYFAALHESFIGPLASRKRPSFVRRWLMYSAVATLGTMRAESPGRLLLLLAQTGLVVLLSVIALMQWVGLGTPDVDSRLSDVASLTAAGVLLLACVAVVSPALALASLLSEFGVWSSVGSAWPFGLWPLIGAIVLVGFAWTFLIPSTHWKLARGIWPSAVFSAFLVLPVVVAVVIASLVVAFIDLLYNLGCATPALLAALKDRSWKALKEAVRGTRPIFRPFRVPGRFH